eukprot:11214654-Karenia_brevis.AAC.1
MTEYRNRHCFQDAGVCTTINLGSDHRAVYADFSLKRFGKKRTWQGGRKPRQTAVGWVPEDTENINRNWMRKSTTSSGQNGWRTKQQI